jgi:hypothetical protein
MGHLRRFERAPATSAIPPTADVIVGVEGGGPPERLTTLFISSSAIADDAFCRTANPARVR